MALSHIRDVFDGREKQKTIRVSPEEQTMGDGFMT